MASKTLEDSKVNGRWTKYEHEKFIQGLKLYGRDWKKIQTLIGTRNGAQIRSHAQKFFIKIKKQNESSELHDNWEQTKESPPQNLNSSVQDNLQTQKRRDYSYYLNKIVQRVSFIGTFDFWASLVDHKSLQNYEIEVHHNRKSSFVSVGPENCHLEGIKPENCHLEGIQPENCHLEGIQPEIQYLEGIQPENCHLEGIKPKIYYLEGIKPAEKINQS